MDTQAYDDPATGTTRHLRIYPQGECSTCVYRRFVPELNEDEPTMHVMCGYEQEGEWPGEFDGDDCVECPKHREAGQREIRGRLLCLSHDYGTPVKERGAWVQHCRNCKATSHCDSQI